MSENALKILLIDDDPTINFLNKLIIERSPVQAEVVDYSDASIALEEISSSRLSVDLILLDLNMPIMDGWEFTRGYAQLASEIQSSKIIILSSSINPSDRNKAEKSPVIDGFFSKPLTIELIQEITKVVSEN